VSQRTWGLISFSKAIAIDCASNAPITIGSFRHQLHSKLAHRHHSVFDCMKFFIDNLTKLIIAEMKSTEYLI
jgi:hypothetical protein